MITVVWKVVLQPHMRGGRTKSSFSQFAELVSLFRCSREAGEDLQQDTLEIKGKDAHPGRQETWCNCPKRKSCGHSKTKDDWIWPQKRRKCFMRHDLQNIIMLVCSSKPIAFLREKANMGRENKYHLEDHPSERWCEMSRWMLFCQKQLLNLAVGGTLCSPKTGYDKITPMLLCMFHHESKVQISKGDCEHSPCQMAMAVSWGEGGGLIPPSAGLFYPLHCTQARR